ncbi:MAG: hypothetical protein K9H25_14540 [Rhodospirillum sp.]|nr:hypothetical protein [Rhodospirillum sp.]MCF8491265.1 hypothetical protein [Rhodospirillum sp.]MCF8502912.1 hypothetical protein [Rhodospirillum sp.]
MSIDFEGLGQQALQFLGLGDSAKDIATASPSDQAKFKEQLDQLFANIQGLAQGQLNKASKALEDEPITSLFKVDGEVIGYQSDSGTVFTNDAVAEAVKSIQDEVADQGLSGIAAATYQADRLKEELSKFYGGDEVEAVVYKDGAAPTVGEVTDALFNGIPLADGKGAASTVAARLGLSQIRFSSDTLGLLNGQPKQ